ncbi:bifunctional UDP-N-acetylglucosamine diphosphorylase/glucosamine-1-phosphate N-acetyltransferase GlmU [endosymbiont of unidentified scaly snail isolate Monju]|uniref:bifunctional UDP-N-acetylglucosamine diphosphorylase/glucosamine-1-phosphate N-acetyltransferase GlmU n=1 Tax=endosymbiont of unidentified scaly snail isolate Monju TaxID=1248727 RepID=UPI0003892257|nr:bifunctional UDP-N-acetylglucosamine diphosphorylase/glucosamine-1-phosphate N-acetyltransferase GlmU [endosymbiont of unidentified scaly snail isolate Monju]BAN70219.1 bifunctional UDP-N-acetylglucosamine pyrophosphorylase/Glucosamine-1-phosphate N-acetyltransferase [endosymbiont of unidentified scaly snail isolate Monju]
MTLGIVILAAGQGTRMKSRLPKVLHHLGDRPLLQHVIDTARALQPARLVIVHGHGGEQVRAAITGDDLIWAEQAEQLGTGHALAQALPHLAGLDQVLVLYGDVPLIRTETLQGLLDAAGDSFGLLTVTLEDPTGYGRICRDGAGQVECIVEQKDATPQQLAIREVNTGIMVLPGGRLADWLGRLGKDNAQGEYYLTDVLAMAVAEGLAVAVAQPAEPVEAEGVNDRLQLASLERAWQRRQAEALMRAGLTLRDPARFDLRGSLRHGLDCEIDIDVVIEGEVTLGEGVRIGPHCVLRDCHIDDGVEVLAHCVIEQAKIGTGSRVGPFARLRPGAELTGGNHVGNFVEIKNAEIGEGSKVNHLSYVGDADIGRGVNIGAGTITCNYDGANKHRTRIGDQAFIGSNTALVAPVSVGRGATIGAGSVISKDAPEERLTLTRARQTTIEGWKRPEKKR